MSNNRILEESDVAEMFKALSNPHRVAIYRRLISCCVPGTRCSPGECSSDECGSECVGDLGKDLCIAPSTVSHHIKELRRAGLIHVERRGQKVECWIEPGTLDSLSTFFVRP
jgi:ArsR family transcriptional regulator